MRKLEQVGSLLRYRIVRNVQQRRVSLEHGIKEEGNTGSTYTWSPCEREVDSTDGKKQNTFCAGKPENGHTF